MQTQGFSSIHIDIDEILDTNQYLYNSEIISILEHYYDIELWV